MTEESCVSVQTGYDTVFIAIFLVLQLEDCALQLYKYNGAQSDYGTYLDLETPLEEQSEEMEGFTEV